MYVHLNVGIFQLFGTNFFDFAMFMFRILKNNPYKIDFKRKTNIFPHTTSKMLSDRKLKNPRLN